jgi:hypothetical protein
MARMNAITQPVPPQASDDGHAPDPPVADESEFAALYALTATSRSGGLHRGNLAVLIRYWTRGEGAIKIGWNRGGDFMRCVRLLSKYVPPGQVKGFCARLHKRATGKWPGPGRNH